MKLPTQLNAGAFLMSRLGGFNGYFDRGAQYARACYAQPLAKLLSLLKSALVGGAVLGLIQPAFAVGVISSDQPIFPTSGQGVYAALLDLDGARGPRRPSAAMTRSPRSPASPKRSRRNRRRPVREGHGVPAGRSGLCRARRIRPARRRQAVGLAGAPSETRRRRQRDRCAEGFPPRQRNAGAGCAASAGGGARQGKACRSAG